MDRRARRGPRLRAVRLSKGVATVDLGEGVAAGRDAESLSARITQLVYTVTSVPGVKSVRLLVSGGVPLGLFPGYAFSRPVTRGAGDAADRAPADTTARPGRAVEPRHARAPAAARRPRLPCVERVDGSQASRPASP